MRGLAPAGFKRVDPEAAKTVDIQAFVDLAEIAPQYFDTPARGLKGNDMGTCEVCGNRYDKAFSVKMPGGDAHA